MHRPVKTQRANYHLQAVSWWPPGNQPHQWLVLELPEARLWENKFLSVMPSVFVVVLFLKIYLFLLESQIYREEERERKILRPMIHSPKWLQQLVLYWSKARRQELFFWSPTQVQDPKAGSWIGSRASSQSDPGACKGRISQLSHCAMAESNSYNVTLNT